MRQIPDTMKIEYGGQVFLASATMGGLEKETMTVFNVSSGSVKRAEG